MSARDPDATPESDRFDDAPHPREMFDLVGHAQAERALLDAWRGGRPPQAWIIGGREGVGKATLAWRFARFVLAHRDPQAPAVREATSLHVDPDHPAARKLLALSHPDLVLLRRVWDDKRKRLLTEIRVDDVRAAIARMHHAAADDGWRVCIVDCADDFNRSTANALLKIVEEPPPRAMFLIVAHKPALVMPTIRSRARQLHLSPLSAQEVGEAVRALGEPWSDATAQDIDAAAARSGGSVRDALRLLDGDGLARMERIERVLDALPQIDWRAVHALADSLAGRDNDDAFHAFLGAVYDWIDTRVVAWAQESAQQSAQEGAQQPGAGVARLARMAEVWEKIAASARETETLNLDRRPLVLALVSDLAAATNAAAA